MFKTRHTACDGCEMPRALEVSVKADILSDYGAGKITREKDMASIHIKQFNN